MALKYLYWQKMKVNLVVYKIPSSFPLKSVVQSKRWQNIKKTLHALDYFKDANEDEYPED